MNNQDWIVKVKQSLKTELVGKRSVILVEEHYLTYQNQEENSNKFHFFVIYKYDNEEKYIAGNAFGKIEGSVKGCLISESSNLFLVSSELYKKMNSKISKGYRNSDSKLPIINVQKSFKIEKIKKVATIRKPQIVPERVQEPEEPEAPKRRKFDLSF